jgi:uncharacterized membrane protein
MALTFELLEAVDLVVPSNVANSFTTLVCVSAVLAGAAMLPSELLAGLVLELGIIPTGRGDDIVLGPAMVPLLLNEAMGQ